MNNRYLTTFDKIGYEIFCPTSIDQITEDCYVLTNDNDWKELCSWSDEAIWTCIITRAVFARPIIIDGYKLVTNKNRYAKEGWIEAYSNGSRYPVKVTKSVRQAMKCGACLFEPISELPESVTNEEILRQLIKNLFDNENVAFVGFRVNCLVYDIRITNIDESFNNTYEVYNTVLKTRKNFNDIDDMLDFIIRDQ